ncbi:hypothetical protein ABH920_009238 [Catenulispora sp. EB89]|uniref:cell wall-binding repeat-containing protein n=1 Tax=Catenulispora sp. EB89 TaxID=3156257 RepID=UPI003517B041
MRSVFTGARRIAGAGLAAAAVLSGGLTAVTAHAAVSTVQDGPIFYKSFQTMSWQGTLYAVNPDGTGRHAVKLTGTGYDPNTSAMGTVRVSPDGSKLAFDSQDGRIYEANADGTDVHPLTAAAPKGKDGRSTWTDKGPAWSPDGKTVYFSREDDTVTPLTYAIESVQVSAAPGSEAPFAGLSGTYVSIASNGDLAYLTGTSEIVADSTGHTLTTIDGTTFGEQASGVLSPDGTKLAVVMDSGPADPKSGMVPTDLYIADSASGWKLTKITAAGNVSPWLAPTWSPDGTKIAYSTGAVDLPITGQATPMTLHVQAPTAGAAASSVVTDPMNTISWQNGALIPVPVTTPPPAAWPVATRLGGADRVGTAIAVADAAYGPQSKSLNKAKVAVLSRDDNYADALSGNALAAQKGGPLLLTGTTGLDTRVAGELKKILPAGSPVYVLGGEAALSPQVVKDLTALHYSVSRLSGPTRFDTSVAVAKAVSAHPHTVLVATGLNAPDALAAGAAAAQDPAGGVVLLSQDGVLPAATKAYLATVNPATTALYGVGRQGVAALKTLPSLAAHVTPLAGGDRYATDLAVASNTTLFPKVTAIGVATGRTWPDALSGGAFIATEHGPLLLVDGPNVPPGVAAWAKAHGAQLTGLTVFGGVNAVPGSAAKGVASDAWGAAWTNALQ